MRDYLRYPYMQSGLYISCPGPAVEIEYHLYCRRVGEFSRWLFDYVLAGEQQPIGDQASAPRKFFIDHDNGGA